MKQIAYISTASKLLDDGELFEILTIARRNNTACDVTGVLLYSDGTFIQAIEGRPADVDNIFANISQDRRHKNIIKLLDEPSNERNFPDWSMGFAVLDEQKAKEVAGFLSSAEPLLNSVNTSTPVTILKTFIATNKLAMDH